MNNRDDKQNKNDYKSEPGISFKAKHIIIGFIILMLLIASLCVIIFNISKESNVESSIAALIDSSKNSISDMFASDDSSDSNEDKDSSSSNNTTKDNENSSSHENKSSSDDHKKSSSSKDNSNSIDFNNLSIEDYAKYCTDKTFGAHAYKDRSCFSQVNFMHNNYTVYINIGTHKSRDDLNSAAVNASVELYKALYTIYPEKFGNTLFGVYISGSYVNDKGNTTESDEVMFSWFDEKTLKSTDINSLTSDNLQDVVYRYYNPYQRLSIQRD